MPILPTLTLAQMKAVLSHLHNPNAIAESENGHVVSVWEDGEVTMEKGGSLFGQRNLHMMEMPLVGVKWPVEAFPVKNANGSHGRIYCTYADSDRVTETLRRIMSGGFIPADFGIEI